MLVLNFHRVETATGFEITRLSPGRLERFLDLIQTSGLRVARPDDGIQMGGHDILLTFDDGFESIAEFALPRIVRRGWSALVFLVAGSVSGYDDWDVRILGRRRRMLSWDQVRAWSRCGICFGSHTMTHADPTALSERALRFELRTSKELIEDELGRRIEYLSYPFGRHNTRVRAIAGECGYRAAFATSGGLSSGNTFALPRTTVNGLMTLSQFTSILSSATQPGTTRRAHAMTRDIHRFLEQLNAGSATVINWRRMKRRGRQSAERRAAPEMIMTPRPHIRAEG